MSAALKLITSSLLRTARACRRRYQLQYVLGYRAAESAHELRFGTAAHLALEAWWLAMKAGLTQDEWLDAAMKKLDAAAMEPADLAKLRVMMMGYHLRWKDEGFEVIGVELQFEGPLVNPATGRPSQTWRIAGKLDVLARRKSDGLVLVIEHKTSSEDLSPGSKYWRRLRMDGQVSVYFEGAAILGHRIDACLYDVLGKPQQRMGDVPELDEHGNKIVLNAAGERVRTAQGKWRQTADTAQGFVVKTRPETLEEFQARVAEAVASAPEKYFGRADVHRLEGDMAGALQDVWQLAQSLREEESAGRFPRNPDACSNYGRECPFFGVCAGEASLDDSSLYSRSDEVHPELAA